MIREVLINDYDSFLKSKGEQTPFEISNRILNMVNEDLNPDLRLVILKFFSIQTLVGIVTLLFCPQFSLSLTGDDAAFHLFHRMFGIYGCMVICGMIFIGSGALTLNLLLKNTEIKKIHQYNIVLYLSLALVSLLSFHLFEGVVHFDMAIAWGIGAILGGGLIFEFSRLLRKHLFSPLFQ